jgi:hypothetical protein
MFNRLQARNVLEIAGSTRREILRLKIQKAEELA